MSRFCTVLFPWVLLIDNSATMAQPAGEQDPLVAKIENALPLHARKRLGSVGGFQYTGSVYTAAMSPDGQRLAVISRSDHVPAIVDVATGKTLQQLPTLGPRIAGNLEFSPDGTALVFFGFQDVRIWDVATGNSRQIPQAASLGGSVSQRHGLSNDAKVFAITCRREDSKQFEELRAFDADGKLSVTCRGIHNINMGVALAPNGKTMASWGYALPTAGVKETDGQNSRMLQIWDIASGKEVRKIVMGAGLKEAGAVYAAGYSPDSKTIAVMSSSSTVFLIDLESGNEKSRLAGAKRLSNLCTLRYSPDGELVAAYDNSGALQAWEAKTGRRLELTEAPPSQFLGVAFPGKDRIVALGRLSRSLNWWDAAGGAKAFQGHRTPIQALTFLPDGKSLVTMGHDRDLIWWDAETGAEQRRLGSIETDASFSPGLHRNDFALAPNGRYVASLSHGRGGIKVWNLKSGKLEWDIPGPRANYKNHIAFSPDSSKIAISGGQDPLRIWDIHAGKELPKIAAGASGGAAVNIRNSRVAFAPDGKMVAVHVNYLPKADGPDAELILWDTVLGENLYQSDRLARLYASNIATGSMAFSSDGRYLALGEAGTIVLLSGVTGKELRRFVSPRPMSTYQLAFSPDGRFLAAGNSSQNNIPAGNRNDQGGEAIIEVWELISGQVRGTFQGHSGPVTCMAFAADGMTLASGSADMTVLLWDLTLKSDGKTAPLEAKDLAHAWATLATLNPQVSATIRRMVQSPEATLAHLREHFPPAKKETVEEEAPDKLVADLDSTIFKMRDAAAKKLARLGERALPALKKSLAANPSLELHRRVLALVKAIESPEITPADLQITRGVEVLERIGNAEARALLMTLSRGDPVARATQEAAAALARLERK